MKKSVYIKTFGCQMNKADSRRLEELFISKGYISTNNEKDASVIVFNTCSVRAHAEDKALSNVGALKNLKKIRPELKVAVVGCMAQRIGEDILKRLPIVDYVMGPSSQFELPEIIERNDTKKIWLDTEESVKTFSEYIPDITLKSMEYVGYVPIMKGCSNYCAYCIVPYVRGRENYRAVNEVLEEVRRLSERGYKEIMFLGQTVNSHPEFKKILKKASEVSDIERIRFVTSYPSFMDTGLIDLVIDTPVLCNYFHIPLQSGSNRVLENMNRKYTLEEYMKIVSYIRKKEPMANISSDFIVGFPGETETDFELTLEAVERAVFDQSFTFKYSPRPGTYADNLDDDVNLQAKQERLARLIEACEKASLERNRILIGKTVELYSEGENHGRTAEYKIVHWEGKPAQFGDKLSVRIDEAFPHSLKGR